jgi:hypothetical protein
MECLFSGLEANTKEHVIPGWLQKRMHLRTQSLILPNKTAIKYKNLVVPAVKSHNEKFGKIEKRISNGVFNLIEVYLWALKIHVGLLYRDSTLKTNIRNPFSKSIANLDDYEFQIRVFRTLYDCWRKNGKIEPTPFGSVFIVDSVTSSDQFDFMHCGYTGSIGIDLGKKFVLAILWDKAKTLNTNALSEWYGHRLDQLRQYKGQTSYDIYCTMALRVWACETAYFAYLHRNESMTLFQSGNTVAASPDLNQYQPKQFNDGEFSLVCKNFGLKILSKSRTGQYVYTPRIT